MSSIHEGLNNPSILRIIDEYAQIHDKEIESAVLESIAPSTRCKFDIEKYLSSFTPSVTSSLYDTFGLKVEQVINPKIFLVAFENRNHNKHNRHDIYRNEFLLDTLKEQLKSFRKPHWIKEQLESRNFSFITPKDSTIISFFKGIYTIPGKFSLYKCNMTIERIREIIKSYKIRESSFPETNSLIGEVSLDIVRSRFK